MWSSLRSILQNLRWHEGILKCDIRSFLISNNKTRYRSIKIHLIQWVILETNNPNSAELLNLNRNYSNLICPTWPIENSSSRFEVIITGLVKFHLVVYNSFKSSQDLTFSIWVTFFSVVLILFTYSDRFDVSVAQLNNDGTEANDGLSVVAIYVVAVCIVTDEGS